MKKILTFSAALLTAGSVLMAATPKSEWLENPENQKKMAGKKAPALKLTQWTNSKELNLEKLKGKVVVLDFWATWCGPCLASVPHMNEMQKKYKGKVVFIGVCHPKGSEKLAQVVKGKKIQYPVAIDINQEAIKKYGINGYPDYIIIDKKGNIYIADCRNSSVEEAINSLLK